MMVRTDKIVCAKHVALKKKMFHVYMEFARNIYIYIYISFHVYMKCMYI